MIVFTLNNQSANRPDYKNYIITRTIFNRSDAAAVATTQQRGSSKNYTEKHLVNEFFKYFLEILIALASSHCAQICQYI